MAGNLVKPASSPRRCPSSPRRRGPSAFERRMEAYGKAAYSLSIGRQAEWNALYRRHQRLGRSRLATPQSCSTRLYSPSWCHAIGVVRVAWNHGSGNYTRKAAQEMEQSMEGATDRGIQSLLARPLVRNHGSEPSHWVPAYAGMTDIACAEMIGIRSAAEHLVDR